MWRVFRLHMNKVRTICCGSVWENRESGIVCKACGEYASLETIHD